MFRARTNSHSDTLFEHSYFHVSISRWIELLIWASMLINVIIVLRLTCPACRTSINILAFAMFSCCHWSDWLVLNARICNEIKTYSSPWNVRLFVDTDFRHVLRSFLIVTQLTNLMDSRIFLYWIRSSNSAWDEIWLLDGILFQSYWNQ